jgi:hypothetical protein
MNGTKSKNRIIAKIIFTALNENNLFNSEEAFLSSSLK